MKRLILSIKKYEKKLAIVEDKRVLEVLIEGRGEEEILGNIYKGKIERILPGMGSVFVDIGQEKNAFLFLNENKIKEKFRENMERLVQVDALPRGTKGARLSLDYSIAGKYVVLLPSSNEIAISNKIDNEDEIIRLKSIFEVENKRGLIIRTCAQGIDKTTLLKEYDKLTRMWEKISENFKTKKLGSVLYTDNDFVKKVVRDFFNDDIDEFIVDDEDVYNSIRDYTDEIEALTLKRKVKKYTAEEDIFSFYEVDKALEVALSEKVWLSCGGYLVIQKTEALISIDVNTGKNVGKKDFESTILQTNLEACVEIARQLRIRNLAGIIIIDFIDMINSDSKRLVLSALEEELKKDRLKTNIVHFTDLGLVEMTRKRQGRELASYFVEECEHCKGTGVIISQDRSIMNFITEFKDLSKEKDIDKIEISAHKTWIKRIKEDFFEYIIAYGEKNKKIVEFIEKETILQNSYEIKLCKL